MRLGPQNAMGMEEKHHFNWSTAKNCGQCCFFAQIGLEMQMKVDFLSTFNVQFGQFVTIAAYGGLIHEMDQLE
jgi:hypothetical protein